MLSIIAAIGGILALMFGAFWLIAPDQVTLFCFFACAACTTGALARALKAGGL